MKRIITALVLLQLALAATAQPPYPAAPPAPGNIVRVEYLVLSTTGTDPGYGNGTPLTITPQPDINGLSRSLNLGALPQGFYSLYIRALDADGRWSITNGNRPFSYIVTPVYPDAPPPLADIVQLEYVLDLNLPYGSGTPVPVTPGTDISNLNVVVDISALSPGPHILYIRSLDATGKWSTTSIRSFSNGAAPNYPAAPAAPGNISRLEYFIDTDPGFGNGTAIPVTPGADITVTDFAIPTTGLAAGAYTLYLRSNTNPWSIVSARSFSVNATLPVSWLYVQGQMTTNGAVIQWATASESNTDRYEVEHSTDGVAFSKLGTVAAAGNSSSTRSYEWLHRNAQQGLNYYRIKQIDKDGRFSYSVTIRLLLASTTRIILTPNPTTAQAVLLFPQPAAKTVLRLLNSNGQQVLQQQVNDGTLQHSLDVSGLPAGVYVLQLHSSNGTQAFKLIKQ